jgi:hypothetical protein
MSRACLEKSGMASLERCVDWWVGSGFEGGIENGGLDLGEKRIRRQKYEKRNPRLLLHRTSSFIQIC